MLCVELVNIIYACMHIHHHGHSIHRARSLNKGEWEAEPSNHPSLCLLEVLWEAGCSGVFVRVHTCFWSVRICWHVRVQRVSPLSILSLVYLRHWQLLSSWSLVNNTSATSILPRGEHHSAGSGAQPDPPLLLPLIHSVGRQNPSPLGTCLTEGKNRDEIAGHGSIPSIPFSISAVIHQRVVVVDVGVVVWLDTAPCLFSENGAAELWVSTEACQKLYRPCFSYVRKFHWC